MITTLALSLVLGAPVPAPTPPVATGPAPRVQEFKPDGNGKLTVNVVRATTRKVTVNQIDATGAVQKIEREVATTEVATVELGDVKDLAITTADGKKVEKEDALKKIAAGAIVVVSSDGKPVSPMYLKVFKDDTLVLSAPELVTPAGATGVRPPIGRPGVQIQPLPAVLPAVPGNVVPVAPGGIQIQIAPAVLPVVPAQPAPAKLPEKK